MASIRVPRRPRTRPDTVLADRAYSSRAIRKHLCLRGIRAVIPQPSDQAGHRRRRGRSGGRPPAFDAEAYKQRNAVERCISRLKQWRGLAMRTDKLAIAYRAALYFAAILIWARAQGRRAAQFGEAPPQSSVAACGSGLSTPRRRLRDHRDVLRAR